MLLFKIVEKGSDCCSRFFPPNIYPFQYRLHRPVPATWLFLRAISTRLACTPLPLCSRDSLSSQKNLIAAIWWRPRARSSWSTLLSLWTCWTIAARPETRRRSLEREGNIATPFRSEFLINMYSQMIVKNFSTFYSKLSLTLNHLIMVLIYHSKM